jgi:hypothetical protein
MSRRSSNVIVSRNSGGWKVTQNGQTLSTHRLQSRAIDSGRTEARHDRTDLVVQGRNGQFRSKDSYGNDPLPPRDREH